MAKHRRGALHIHAGKAPANDAAHDGNPPYSREVLERMNALFISRVERALKAGSESRKAAELTSARLR